MAVRLIVDSASDIPKAYAEERGLLFLPLKTCIDGVEYLDGVTITHADFFEKLAAAKEIPTTSQVSPHQFEEAFRRVKSNGDEAVVITISGKLSGTFQSAKIASAGFETCVHLVDSLNATVGERVLIEYAVRLRDEGRTAAEIAAALCAVRDRVCLLGLVDTLRYLVKGGRLSKAAGFTGETLGIKPVLSIRDGELVVLGKAMGAKKSRNLLTETIQKKGGIDFSLPLMLGYSGADDVLLREYVDASRALWAEHSDALPVSTIGSTIGTHAGPGLVAVAFFTREETI